MGLLDDLQRLNYGKDMGEGFGSMIDYVLQERVGSQLRPQLQEIFGNLNEGGDTAMSSESLYDAITKGEQLAAQHGVRGQREIKPFRNLADEVVAREQQQFQTKMMSEQLKSFEFNNWLNDKVGVEAALTDLDLKQEQVQHYATQNQLNSPEGRREMQELKEKEIHLQHKLSKDLVDYRMQLERQQVNFNVSMEIGRAMFQDPHAQHLFQYIDNKKVLERIVDGNVDINGLAYDIFNEKNKGKDLSADEAELEQTKIFGTLLGVLSRGGEQVAQQARMEQWKTYHKTRSEWDSLMGPMPAYLESFESWLAHYNFERTARDPEGLNDVIRARLNEEGFRELSDEEFLQLPHQKRTDYSNLLKKIEKEGGEGKKDKEVQRSDVLSPWERFRYGSTPKGKKLKSEKIEEMKTKYEDLRNMYEEGGLSQTERMEMLNYEKFLRDIGELPPKDKEKK